MNKVKGSDIMPEKKTGVFDMIMGVFRNKRDGCDDIVAEAENIISNYINIRRNMIAEKYRRKSRLMSFLLVGVSACVLYMIYRVFV